MNSKRSEEAPAEPQAEAEAAAEEEEAPKKKGKKRAPLAGEVRAFEVVSCVSPS
jgi:hypothetical protein